jgi:hypothetical protein
MEIPVYWGTQDAQMGIHKRHTTELIFQAEYQLRRNRGRLGRVLTTGPWILGGGSDSPSTW